MLNILPRFTPRSPKVPKRVNHALAGHEEYNCVTPALQLGFCSGLVREENTKTVIQHFIKEVR